MDLFFRRDRGSGAGPEVDAPSVLAPAPRPAPSVEALVVPAGVAGFVAVLPNRLVLAVAGAADAALDVAVFPPNAPLKRLPVAVAGAVAEEVAAEDDAAGGPPKENVGVALAAGFVPKRLPVVPAGSVVCFTPEPNSEGAVAEVVDVAAFDVVPAGVEEGVDVPPMAPKRLFGAAESAGLGAPNKLEPTAGAIAAGVVDCDVCVLLGVCPALPNSPPEAGVLVFWPPNKLGV